VYPYGSFLYLPPTNSNSDPNTIYSCYEEEDVHHAVWFEDHEWENHCVCAGVANAKVFFEMVCSLLAGPLNVMEEAKENFSSMDNNYGDPFEAMVGYLTINSYAISSVTDHTKQIYLSVCASESGEWMLAAESDFSDVCGPTTV